MDCTSLGHLQAGAQAARRYSNKLAAEVADAALEALFEMGENKADKPMALPLTIAGSGWIRTGTGSFPYVCDSAVQGVTGSDRINVTVTESSAQTAMDCGLCPVCESLDGKLRLRAQKAPSADISVEIWIERG